MISRKAVKSKGTSNTVKCTVFGARSAFEPQEIGFSTGTDLTMSLEGEIGPRGITRTAADLVDFAIAIYQIERQLKGRQRTNPPEVFQLSMRLRNPNAWRSEAIELIQQILLLLGNARWEVEFSKGLPAKVPEHAPVDKSQIRQVALFSGGMDSTCGLASIHSDRASTRLVSFYTRQKRLQQSIASDLGFSCPAQWTRKWNLRMGRAHSFYYRSFLFLSLAAATAESWGVQRTLQFENGVLASSIPPSPSWMMTKHAHPSLHKMAAELFSILLGGDWKIENPFLLSTKRDCFKAAIAQVGKARATELMKRTETCWFLFSNRVIGGDKKPGIACGICIPCIVRRTALQDNDYAWDLRKNSVKNDDKLGLNFRSYYGFLEEVSRTKDFPTKFYALLPAPGRELVAPGGAISLEDLHLLLLRFSSEFMDTFL